MSPLSPDFSISSGFNFNIVPALVEATFLSIDCDVPPMFKNLCFTALTPPSPAPMYSLAKSSTLTPTSPSNKLTIFPVSPSPFKSTNLNIALCKSS